MIRVPKVAYSATWYYLNAWFYAGAFADLEVDGKFLSQISKANYSYSPKLPIEHVKKLTQPIVIKLAYEAYSNALKSIIASSVCFVAILAFFLLKGTSAKTEKHISGLKISSPRWLAWRLKFAKKASNFLIGTLPLVKGTETRHMMITGGTGSGKTNCLHHMLMQIRDQKQKTIIIDTCGIFVEKYYRPDKDIILNPFDKRSAQWNPWAEGDTPFDYADIAESFIPHSNSDHDSYWRDASKTVFSTLLEKFADTRKTSDIVQWIQYESLANLCKLMAGTPAAAHMDLSSEKTASSIRSVSSTFLSSLRALEDTSTPFSIREWLERDDDSWLFIQSVSKQRTILRPLMAAWISASIRGLLALKPNLDRRIWFIIDELPTLQRVKDLESLLTEGRKYGGCGVLVLQTPAQLDEIYGREVSQVITANTATKIVFQEEDPIIADRISRAFGEREITERQEGISYGAHETRDGVSLSMQKKSKPIVSPTQILQLPINTAFVKLASGSGITKVRLNIINHDKLKHKSL
jgi:type IV conjugative transfer system coupling protein TraD